MADTTKTTVDYSEYSSESIDDMIEDIAAESKLQYPLKNDGHKAKIDFNIMQVISPVSIGNEGGEHIKEANESFKAAKDANRRSREAKNKSNTHLNRSKTLGKLKDDAEAQAISRALEQSSKRNSAAAKKLKEKSLKHATAGKESLKEAFDDFTSSSNFTDRKVIKRDGVPTIQLYLPVAFQQNDSFSIPGTELGLLGAGALAGMNSGSGLLKSTMDQFSQGLGSVFDMAKGNLNASQAAVVTARLASKFTPSEVASAFSLAAGVTVNPNLRSVFKGVNLREYSFQFKFLPKSKKEAEIVEKIIRTFRTYSYPEVIDMGPVAAGYKYPDLFSISVYVEQKVMVEKVDEEGNKTEVEETKQVLVGNKIKDCYLRSVSTNYNASSMAFHPDGRPVEIDLSLNFVEEETISRRDVKDGY
jgi:hypothetical protein